MWEQAHHVIAVRGQLSRLVDCDREVVLEVTPITQVSDPLGSGIGERTTFNSISVMGNVTFKM